MATYIITYDLQAPHRDYESLYAAIKAYGTWAHVNESTWVVVTSHSAVQVRDYLTRHVDGDDSIFVVKSGGEAAWRQVLCEGTWLKEHL